MNSDLRQRVTTGAAISAVALAVILIGGRPLIFITALIAVAIAFEFATSIASKNPALQLTSGLVSVLTASAALAPTAELSLQVVMLSASVALISAVIRAFRADPNSQELLIIVLSFAFSGMLSYSLLKLAMVTGGGVLALWFVLIVSASDIGAYFGGRTLQGPKLAPSLSPNKTISGAISGFLSSIAVSVCYSPLLTHSFNFERLMIVAAVVAITSQFGDLAGSYIKRLFGTKDYGNLLPGHGGVLDRVVAHGVAAPFFLYFL